ncbi:MAG: hypothetical protein Kow0065_19820 [Methylomicrobium sp.]
MKNNQDVFVVEIGASSKEKRLVKVFALLAIIAVLQSAVALYLKIGLWTVIAYYTFRQLQQIDKIKLTIRFSYRSGWELKQDDSFEMIGILKSTVLTPQILFLHYKLKEKSYYRIIFDDATDPDRFRYLIMQLKANGLSSPESKT